MSIGRKTKKSKKGLKSETKTNVADGGKSWKSEEKKLIKKLKTSEAENLHLKEQLAALEVVVQTRTREAKEAIDVLKQSNPSLKMPFVSPMSGTRKSVRLIDMGGVEYAAGESTSQDETVHIEGCSPPEIRERMHYAAQVGHSSYASQRIAIAFIFVKTLGYPNQRDWQTRKNGTISIIIELLKLTKDDRRGVHAVLKSVCVCAENFERYKGERLKSENAGRTPLINPKSWVATYIMDLLEKGCSYTDTHVCVIIELANEAGKTIAEFIPTFGRSAVVTFAQTYSSALSKFN